jgi:hypothetical protein
MDVVAFLNLNPTELLILMVCAPAAIFWMVQFFIFIQMEDAAFPGRYDKLIWGIALTFMNVPAALVFREWRYRRRREMAARARGRL